MASIDKVFRPRTVALIGATDREGSVGKAILENLLQGKEQRSIYPVNPKRDTIMGLQCYPSVSHAPEHIDLAVIATPAETVPGVVKECAEAGVDGAVVISAGFREIGKDGVKLEEAVKNVQSESEIRILGPNCLGFIRPDIGLNATFLRESPEPGQIAFVSQSGALGSAILNWAVSTKIGFSLFVSLGSMLDIDYGDIIDYLGEDTATRSIIIYMESIGNAKKFMSAARGFARSKPIIVLKAGKHPAGAQAARSHTGALAGDYQVYDAAFKRVGVIRVDEISDLFNCASVLDSRFLPAGSKLGIVTNAGGPAVIASDAVMDYGGAIAKLSDETIHILNDHLPRYWSHGNPIDILGDADVSRYEAAIRTALGDPGVDGLLVIYTPQGAASAKDLAEMVVKVAAGRHKPLLTVLMGEESVREARDAFYAADIPTYPTPEEAVRTYMYMYRYRRNLDTLYQTPEELPVDLSPPKSHLKLLIQRMIKAGRTLLGQEDADKFLDSYGIPRVKGDLARSVEDAVIIASNIGYPVVLKIMSPDISHKTDVNGIVAGVASGPQLKLEFEQLLSRVAEARPDAKIDGVYVQKMVEKIDYELILGSKKDHDFGSVILFGLGGISVEIFKDFSIGLPPLNQALARRLMEETKVYQVLSKGMRNRPPADLKLLEEIMVRFSNMVIDFPEIADIDINPLAVSDGRLYALDARIILDPAATNKRNESYPHLAIVPYPTKWVTPWRLADGTDVILRPVRPEDEPLELEFVRSLSDESSRARFFRIIKNLKHESLVRFSNIDYDREMAFIAETKENGQHIEIGVGRLILEPNRRRGEFAVVVTDKYQDKGLGTKLVDMLINWAEEKGLERIYGIILPENRRMIQLSEKLGFHIEYLPEEVFVDLQLK
jgi:acetyltransferase